YQPGVIGVLNNMGNVYLQQGQFDLAEDSFHKSLELATSAKYRPQVSLALNNIGRVHHLRGHLAKALEYYQQSLALREELGDKTGATRTLINLAEVYKDLKDYDRSTDYYKKTLERLESSGNKADLPVTIAGLGQLQLVRGDPKSALEWLERATTLAREGERPDVLWLALTITGKAHQALKEGEKARAAFTEAIEVVEELRDQIAGGEQEQQLFLEDKLLPYESLVELLVERNEWMEAFSMSERAKARVLLDVLQSGRTSLARRMTAVERELERKLRGSMVAINNQLLRETQASPINDNRISGLKARRQQARLNYESFRTNLYAAHPELKKQRGDILPISLEQAGDLLPDAHSALLEYSLSGDKVFLFVLTKSAMGASPANLKVYELAIGSKELAQKADSFRLSLAQRDLTYGSVASELYKILLGPAEAQLRGKTSLVIVPAGKLWDLPFQALQNARRRHLIEDFAISYAPSLTVLREMKQLRHRQQPANAVSNSLLAIGNPSLGEAVAMNGSGVATTEKPGKLIETERQVSALAELYGRSRSRVYTGDMARESRFKAEAGGYRVVQLATHGVLNDADPMYSHVVLAREQFDAEEDGILEAWELMNLNLNADLVSLSACETARGRTSAGEGVIGLSWALFVAGTPTTL
ncbi:MAG: CHAT domain-containing protein, partial [Acidobacteriota bacterium]